MEIKIEINTIKAAKLCAAIKDVRYYLKAIHVRALNGVVFVESTDGHIAYQTKAPQDDLVKDVSVLIPMDIINNLLKIVRKGSVLLEQKDEQWTIGDLKFVPLDARFPDLDRVIPKRQDVSSDLNINSAFIQFNPDLLVRCRDALNLTTGYKRHAFKMLYPTIESRKNVSLMICDEDYPFCLVIPIRL